jgi:hypothetical protein
MPYLRKGKGREANIIEGKNRVKKEIGERMQLSGP